MAAGQRRRAEGTQKQDPTHTDVRARIRRSPRVVAAKAEAEDCGPEASGDAPAGTTAAAADAAALDKAGPSYVYRLPPHSDAKGVAIACTILSLWSAAFYFCHFCVRLAPSAVVLATTGGGGGGSSATTTTLLLPASPWWLICASFLVLTHLYMGLFVTAHDAMHGAVCGRRRRRALNDALGRACITCYAFFSYARLYEEHWRHHHWTGRTKEAAEIGARRLAAEAEAVAATAMATVARRSGADDASAAGEKADAQNPTAELLTRYDPDYHRGDARLLPWFCGFMAHYSSPGQYAKTGAAVALLMLLGAPYANLCVYMCGSAVLAAFQLFYWGTYRPHRPDAAALRAHVEGGDAAAAEMPWRRSRSAPFPLLVLFLQAYFFNLHWHHHRWPYCPWWDLPRLKREAGEAGVVPTGEGAEEGEEAY